MKINQIHFLAILFFFTGYVKAQTSFDYGKVEENIYSNTFFNCTISLPENWVVVDLPFDNGVDKEQKKDISEIFSANLLSIFKYPLNSGTQKNPGISIVVENVADYPQVKNGNDYLQFVKNGLENSIDIKNRVIDEVLDKEVINGIEFYKLNFTDSADGIVLKQIYCATVVKGFSFSIIYVYENDLELSVIKKSLKTLKFIN